jgi:prolipoprotein diacylglyceryltransferase
MYNSMYIISPIIIEILIMRDATISVGITLSVLLIVLGIFLMNLFKQSEKANEKELNLLG